MGHIYTATKPTQPEPKRKSDMSTTADTTTKAPPTDVIQKPPLEAGGPTRGGSVAGIDPYAIETFRKNARMGRLPGASNGQKIANRLAKALQAIGDDLAILDADTLQGACDLMLCMSGPWPTDRLREVIFNTVASAAGKGGNR